MSRFAAPSVRFLLIALSVVPLAAWAQERSFASGTAVGVTVQAISLRDGWAEVPAVALHVTSIRASRFGVDLTVGTVPSALASGLFLVTPDVGIARLFPIAGGALMLKAGPSAILVGAGHGLGGVVGAHVGATAFVRVGSSFGFRGEVVPRIYAFEGGIVRVTTFGIGLTSLPDRPR
jgi:hypothetical protein